MSAPLDNAMEAYRTGECSLGKATEISGVSRREFERALAERGVERNYDASCLAQDIAWAKAPGSSVTAISPSWRGFPRWHVRLSEGHGATVEQVESGALVLDQYSGGPLAVMPENERRDALNAVAERITTDTK